MDKWACMWSYVRGVGGVDGFEAADIVEAARMAKEFAVRDGGKVLRVELCDFGAFEFMR